MAILIFFKLNNGRSPSPIFRSSKFLLTVYTVQGVNMRPCTKFRADRSNSCRDIAIFRYFKMSAVHRLGFLIVRNFNCLRFVGSLNMPHGAKVRADRSIHCRDMSVFAFIKTVALRVCYMPAKSIYCLSNSILTATI